GELLRLGVYFDLLGAADAGLAHPAGDHGRMAGLAAAAGQDALGGDHAVQVVRVGLPADQDHLLALAGQLDRAGRVEDDLADRGTRRRADAGGDLGDLAAGVEPGEHQPGQLLAGNPADRLVHVDQALVDQLRGDAEGGRGGARAHPGLQHPQLAALDGELDVAQVAVVVLQRVHDLHQLVVGGLVDALQVLQRDGVPDPGHDVLALGVLQVVTVDALGAGARVPGKGDAGARVHAQVAEDHRHHVHGGAQVGGDALLAAVEDSAGRVPGVEHGLDGQVQLLPRVLREVAAGLRLDDALE